MPVKKVREGSKPKLTVEGEYDPSSPTSEDENEENPAKKAALSSDSSPKKDKEVRYAFSVIKLGISEILITSIL